MFSNSSGYGMFTGGLGFQYGAERLGALTVPAAAGNSKRQIKFITDFRATALHAIPSYAIRLAEVFQEEGIDPASTTLKPSSSEPNLIRTNSAGRLSGYWVSKPTTVSA